MLGILALAVLALAVQANGDCECGYKVGLTTFQHALVINDFSHPDIPLLPDLVPLSEPGPVKGSLFETRNVFNALGALQLQVRGAYDGPDYNASGISGAGMATVRGDVQFGSFQAEMKGTWVSGTVGGFGVESADERRGVDVELFSAGPEYVHFVQRPERMDDFGAARPEVGSDRKFTSWIYLTCGPFSSCFLRSSCRPGTCNRWTTTYRSSSTRTVSTGFQLGLAFRSIT